jgi:hypothetical protein
MMELGSGLCSLAHPPMLNPDADITIGTATHAPADTGLNLDDKG